MTRGVVLLVAVLGLTTSACTAVGFISGAMIVEDRNARLDARPTQEERELCLEEAEEYEEDERPDCSDREIRAGRRELDGSSDGATIAARAGGGLVIDVVLAALVVSIAGASAPSH